MRNVVFAINLTADGCAGHEYGIADDELHEHFTALLKDSDVEVFGRNTYDLMYPYWHEVAIQQSESAALNEFAQTFDAMQKIVFSTTLETLEWNNTTLMRGNLQEEIVKLKQQPGKDISIAGLQIASQLAHAGLIDEYRFLIHPVIAGKGPRLFETGKHHSLELIGTKTLRSGVVELHYKSIRAA